MLILREAFLGLTRFAGFQQRLSTSRNILSQRLAHLVKHGVLQRVRYSEHPPRYEYRLIAKGVTRGPVEVPGRLDAPSASAGRTLRSDWSADQRPAAQTGRQLGQGKPADATRSQRCSGTTRKPPPWRTTVESIVKKSRADSSVPTLVPMPQNA